jgi:hypothetical protein
MVFRCINLHSHIHGSSDSTSKLIPRIDMDSHLLPLAIHPGCKCILLYNDTNTVINTLQYIYIAKNQHFPCIYSTSPSHKCCPNATHEPHDPGSSPRDELLRAARNAPWATHTVPETVNRHLSINNQIRSNHDEVDWSCPSLPLLKGWHNIFPYQGTVYSRHCLHIWSHDQCAPLCRKPCKEVHSNSLMWPTVSMEPTI